MVNHSLSAISPIDGRYYKQVEELSLYFSEYALIKYRVFVEIEYFIALCELPVNQLKDIEKSKFDDLRSIYKNFAAEDALEVKDIEKTTNHDVKAVEYFIKKRFDKLELERYKEFIHFGLTSQDINNTSVPLSLLEGIRDVFMPRLKNMLEPLRFEWAFGDGSTSEDRIPPVHSYEPGRYTAVLTVTTQDAQVFTASRTIVVDYPCG